MHGKLEATAKAGRYCRVILVLDIEFEVLEEGTKMFVVDLDKRISNCRVYQVSELSYNHILLCIAYVGYDVIDYIYKKFKKATYLSTYE